jgi:hypothetical protein
VGGSQQRLTEELRNAKQLRAFFRRHGPGDDSAGADDGEEECEEDEEEAETQPAMSERELHDVYLAEILGEVEIEARPGDERAGAGRQRERSPLQRASIKMAFGEQLTAEEQAAWDEGRGVLWQGKRREQREEREEDEEQEEPRRRRQWQRQSDEGYSDSRDERPRKKFPGSTLPYGFNPESLGWFRQKKIDRYNGVDLWQHHKTNVKVSQTPSRGCAPDRFDPTHAPTQSRSPMHSMFRSTTTSPPTRPRSPSSAARSSASTP